MKSTEDAIKYEGTVFYVIEVRKGFYEVRKQGPNHSYVVGSGTDLEGCKRTAQKLERYPTIV